MPVCLYVRDIFRSNPDPSDSIYHIFERNTRKIARNKGENTVYNIEIQATKFKYLAKRMRYYQGLIDLNIIDKGEEYSSLKKSFVIFICTYDPFGGGTVCLHI